MNLTQQQSFLSRHHRLLFYACWVILGLIQSRYTELLDDEAYYWVYGQYLDWGYFDHPPMIGLLVKMGYAIFPNELGVRLFPLLLNVGSLLIIENLLTKKNPLLFYAIALSIAILQLTGFYAVPDSPLIFFTALFFAAYKRFLDRSSLLNILLLGVTAALLCYSKYHAVLVVLFVLLSNLKLFTRYPIYLAGLVAFLLYAPHLWWQYQHDWVSFRYHLFESNVNPYKISHTTSYILGQLFLPGPVIGVLLLPAAFLYKPTNDTEKALRYTMIGIYVFFFLSSFRGKVEANWTSPAMIPLFILAHQALLEKTNWQKWIYKLLPVTLVLVLFARVIMIVDIIPAKFIRERYHSWKGWPAAMREKTQGLPIVFSSSYQRASKYWFYSGQMTYSLNWYRERPNNYNFWPVEDSLLGKPVYFLDKHGLDRFTDSLKTPMGWVGYQYDSSFASFTRVQVLPSKEKYTAGQNDSLRVSFTTDMPAYYRAFIAQHPDLKTSVTIGLFNKKGWIKEWQTPLTLQQITNGESTVVFKPGLEPGKYYMRFSILADYNSTHNSRKIDLKIE